MKSPRFSHRPAVLCFVASTCLPLGLAAPSETAAPPRTHVLFMGADLSLQRDKKLYRVEDVTGSEFKIHVNGEDVLVRTRQAPVNLHIDADLKLSGLSVQLDELKAGPGYTHGNDPMRKLEEAGRNAAMMADQGDYATAALQRAKENLAAAANNAAHSTDEARNQREVAAAQVAVDKAGQFIDYTTLAAGSDLSNLGSGAHRMALAQGQFDAMDVSFKVSSPVELDRPYVVILFKFHDPAEKPGVDGQVIHAQALDPIDAKPRYVRILQGGLPTAFKMVDCSVHLYNRGEELATNCSDKRVELTRAEAQQYVAMQYRGEHKGATLPAAAMRGTLSRAQRQGLTHAQQTRTVYTKVGPDGAVLGIFSDKDCTVALDDAGVKGALGEVFFTPALDQGKPVDGIARVRLADL